MMQVVEATLDDIWIIQTLSKRIWPVTFAEILSEEQIRYMMDMMYGTDAMMRQMTIDGHHYLLVKDTEEYLAYVSYETDYQKTAYTKVHKIYVSPATQGRGVGRFLLDRVAEIALASQNKGLQLNVNRYNKAVAFYRNCGFEVVGTEDIDIGQGFLMEDYIMKKEF